MVTSLLAYLPKAVPAQHPNDLFGTANRKAIAHLSATSSTFAPAGNVTGAGSNQRSSASLAFRTASSSVSPAEAHPGNSGKNAAQRLVWGSCSTTSRSFMGERITPRCFGGKPQMSDLRFVFIGVDSWLTLQPQDIARLIEEFFRLAAGNSRRYGCQGHEFAFGDRSR